MCAAHASRSLQALTSSASHLPGVSLVAGSPMRMFGAGVDANRARAAIVADVHRPAGGMVVGATCVRPATMARGDDRTVTACRMVEYPASPDSGAGRVIVEVDRRGSGAARARHRRGARSPRSTCTLERRGRRRHRRRDGGGRAAGAQETSKPITIIDAAGDPRAQRRSRSARSSASRPACRCATTAGRDSSRRCASAACDRTPPPCSSTACACATPRPRRPMRRRSCRPEFRRRPIASRCCADPASSLYGTNAVGGVVNIVTRQGGGPLARRRRRSKAARSVSRARAGRLAAARSTAALIFAGGLMRTTCRRPRRRRRGAQHGRRRARCATASIAGDEPLVPRASDRTIGVQNNTSPTATGIPAANIPQQTIVDAIAGRAGCRSSCPMPDSPFAIGNATYIPAATIRTTCARRRFCTTALQVPAQRMAAR